MSSQPPYTISTHSIPSTHIRGFPRGARPSPTTGLPLPLSLHIKQYTPNPPATHPGSLTLILTHGVGSSKECYEPFFTYLVTHPSLRGRIRSIFAMDAAHHGQSYLLNRHSIGDTPHWFDNARDTLHMINTLQHLMPPPIVGIGQSWGCVTIAMAAVMHPRVFAGVVFLEPTFAGKGDEEVRGDVRNHRAGRMMQRKEGFANREEARRKMRANGYYGRFDPDVFEKVVEFDLRDVDGEDEGNEELQANIKRARNELKKRNERPENPGPPVTLTTPKSQEVYTLLRPNPPLPGHPSIPPDNLTPTAPESIIPGFYRPEVTTIQSWIPYILPPTLLLWGCDSDVSHEHAYHSWLLEELGAGRGGNGGVKAGKVEEKWVEGAGHSLPLEKPKETAAAAAMWLEGRMEEWEGERVAMMEGPEIWAGILDPEFPKRAEAIKSSKL
ncbi:alpha/beta-hydrolase [Saccharata proteae CBS 121410]|uniref:Alpha/beta-hydrolase n=1 Tax=Saccharata proteae CBS 121410 TaxID=1314787 RepID=A0A6A5YCR4_9PEZI|nr:alpha/beta-hydrolase [Saccharata proteae CBS 121410]